MLKQYDSGLFVKCLMVKKSELADIVKQYLKLAATAGGKPDTDRGDGKGTDTPPEKDTQDAPEEVRTLWVDFDPRGERFKEWRQVCLESRTERWGDGHIEGPASLLHWMNQTARSGQNPKLWLAEFCRDRRIERSDRVFHELQNLVEVIYIGGTYDQLNMPALQSFERISRRIATIVDAYSGPGNPSWRMARHYEGVAGVLDAVAPALRQWGIKKAKDENELNTARTRGLKGSAGEDDEGGGDDDKAEGGSGKPKGGGRGRGSAPKS